MVLFDAFYLVSCRTLALFSLCSLPTAGVPTKTKTQKASWLEVFFLFLTFWPCLDCSSILHSYCTSMYSFCLANFDLISCHLMQRQVWMHAYLKYPFSQGPWAGFILHESGPVCGAGIYNKYIPWTALSDRAGACSREGYTSPLRAYHTQNVNNERI